MIEAASAVRIYCEALGAKGAKGRFIRIAPEGFYEVIVESGGKQFTGLLPVAGTVILSAEPELVVQSIEVER